MAFNFASLEPRIYQILSAPGTDLATISAKRVRRQLLELDPSLTAEFLKEYKEDVDAVIASVFESEVQRAAEGTNGTTDHAGERKSSSRKAKKEEDVEMEDDDDDEPKSSPAPKKASKKGSKNGRELSDAELARKLSSEINGPSTRTGGKTRGSSTTTKKGAKSARAKKSAATIDSDDDSDNAGGKKKTRKSTNNTGGAKGGFGKEFVLSEPLAAVMQVERMSRPQVVKQLWVYIKGNDLQNPANRREILCDPNLRAVFGVDKIDMFKMNKVLGQHFHEIE